MMFANRSLRRVAVLTVLGMSVAACGGDDDSTVSEEAAATATGGDDGPEGDEPEADPAPEAVTLTFGGTQSTSSFFAFLVAHSRLAGDVDGAMSINVRETGAALENISLVDEGSADLGLSGLRTVVQAYRGLGPFEGAPIPDICNLINVAVNAEQIIVHESIESIWDLEGQPFAPGFQGTGLYDNLTEWFDVLGIDVDVFDGSLEDIINAMKDGRIVGFAKAGNGFIADASMLDVASAVPVRAIGFDQDAVDRILAADPMNPVLYQFVDMPAGTIFDNDDTLISVVTTNYFADESMPDDVARRLARAMWESLEEAAQQTGVIGAQDVTPDLTLSTVDAVPLCPGSQQFFDELG